MMLSGGRPGKFQISVPVLDLYLQIIFLKGKEALIFSGFQSKNNPVIQLLLLKLLPVIAVGSGGMESILLFTGLLLLR